MRVDEKAKQLLLGESCISCTNSLEIGGKLRCVYSPNFKLGDMKPLAKEGWCENYQKGWYEEFQKEIDSNSNIIIFNEDGKPTGYNI